MIKIPLETLIIEEILQTGDMDIGRFMTLALSHPAHGYYMTRDPFGRGGDFTTAPEISQMFGEMIGAWAVQAWQDIGAPPEVALLECGPGRGTLMADILRVARKVPVFERAVRVHLLEISPVLKARQAEILAGEVPVWHAGLETVPKDCPLIVVANEFLDALPFQQLEQTAEGWRERVVKYTPELGLCFGLKPIPNVLKNNTPEALCNAPVGAVFEVAPARVLFVRQVKDLIQKQGGAALFVDYGSEKSGLGDSFQAVKKHSYGKIFAHIGESDLTSHVDFGALKRAVPEAMLTTQRDFLRGCGIEARAKVLEKVNPSVQDDLERLIGVAQMGALFKVLCFGS